MKFIRFSAVFWLVLTAAAFGQTPSTAGETVLVVPFENQSKAPGIEWIGDSFPDLASVLEAENELAAARSEAEQALRLRQFSEPLLVLAKLDLRDNRAEAAAENIDKALHLEPSNAAALALKRAVAAKLAQEAQPLPNR